MVLLRKVDYRQIKLSRKTTKNNLDLEKSELIEKKDLKESRKETRSKQKTKRLEQKVEKEIKKEAKPEQQVEEEERIEQ